MTGPDYGRIYDHELVEAVQRIAGNGNGDTRWKVPGVLDWSTGVYNPRVDITKDTTTLYASDRDVFLFLVDDLNPTRSRPAAARRLAGPLFPGLLLLELGGGAKTLGIASFYLRAVCQNRNLWVSRISRRSPSATPKRGLPLRARGSASLTRFANSSPMPFVNGIKAAREKIVARTDEDRSDFLRNRASPGRDGQDYRHGAGRGRAQAREHLRLRAGITAVARDKPHQDARLDLEGRAKKLLDRAPDFPKAGDAIPAPLCAFCRSAVLRRRPPE